MIIKELPPLGRKVLGQTLCLIDKKVFKKGAQEMNMAHQLRVHTSFAEDSSLHLIISHLPMTQARGNTKPLASTQTHISTQTQRHIHAHT